MKLLPCPFCGKEPEIDKYKIQGVMHWDVSCMNDNCLVLVETDSFESEEDAMKAWNKRTS